MGLGTKSCIVFCYLNATCALLIAYFFRAGLSSMAIVSVVNKWDPLEKSRACRNAGFLYLILAVAMTIKDAVDRRREGVLASCGAVRQGQLPDYAVGAELSSASQAETQPLLPVQGGGGTTTSAVPGQQRSKRKYQYGSVDLS